MFSTYNTSSHGQNIEDDSLCYELGLRRAALCRLCAIWQKSVQSLDFGDAESLPPWGPSADEILAARMTLASASLRTSTDERSDVVNRQGDDDTTESDEDTMDEDLSLVYTLDAVDLADSFCGGVQEDDVY